MVEILAPTMTYAIAITPDNPRGLSKEILMELIRKTGVECVTAKDREEALSLARKQAGAEDVILVCGSLSFLAEYLHAPGTGKYIETDRR